MLSVISVTSSDATSSAVDATPVVDIRLTFLVVPKIDVDCGEKADAISGEISSARAPAARPAIQRNTIFASGDDKKRVE